MVTHSVKILRICAISVPDSPFKGICSFPAQLEFWWLLLRKTSRTRAANQGSKLQMIPRLELLSRTPKPCVGLLFFTLRWKVGGLLVDLLKLNITKFN